MDQHKNELYEAAHTAHAVHNAIKTGKALSAAAKGAAVGGPYGAALGTAISNGKHLWKVAAAAATLLLLPVLFVAMLPSLIFGGLLSSGQPGQPVLNDDPAITANMERITRAVTQILAEGVEDAKLRAAADFGATDDGDRYEIKNPFEGGGNVNSFLAQYCASRAADWEEISIPDLERVLRQGKDHLYSFTRTREVREVEDDDPTTENIVETKTEVWYVYTLVYNGESYFEAHVFHLTDQQKALADSYAQNLSIFLNDGVYQSNSPGASYVIDALGNVTFTDGSTPVVYFNQKDERYANQPYGTDNVGDYGCGPTAMSIVVSSLTGQTIDPPAMAKWAYENGYWCSGSGSYLSLIPGAARNFGLPVEGCSKNEPQRIVDALSSGKLVVAIMSKGHFTRSGHFIVLRGIQNGKILVADPASYSRSQMKWELSLIVKEASSNTAAGGPFWIIG